MTDEQQPPEPSGDVEQKQDRLDKLRGTGVGMEDPNIVGDAGPTDVPPGEDPDPGAPNG